MSKIILTEEEKDIFEPLIENVALSKAAFKEAAELLESSKEALWKRIKQYWPGAVYLHHPEEGVWHVIIDDLLKDVPDEVA